MAQLLINYANNNYIKLDINEKNKVFGTYPLLYACGKNNTEIV